jgi:succinoglycan biosynthesis transport protein ExoP
MSANTQLMKTYGTPPPSAVHVPHSQNGAAPAPNILKIIHGGLRGRYTIAILLGAVLGAGAACVAWRLTHLVYRSEGLVRIAYSLPEILQETDQNRPMLMFDTFMQSQKMLMTSRRVIDQAIQDPVWKQYNKQVPEDPDDFYANNMKVEIGYRSEYIAVSVTDRDPATAAAAVTAVINAYSTFYNELQAQLERQRIGVLDDKLNTVKSQGDGLEQQLVKGELEYGTTDLSPFCEAAVARVTKLEAALGDVRAAMATASSMSPTTMPAGAMAANGTNADSMEALTPPQIAAMDPVMQQYWMEQSRLEDQLDQLRIQGLGDAHKEVVRTKELLELARRRVQNYAGMYRTYHAATAQNLGDPRNQRVATAGLPLNVLRANEASLNDLYVRSKSEMVKLGLKQSDLRRQREQLKGTRDEQEQLARRITVLRGEEQLGGRLSIISTGEIALSPERGKRLQIAAAVGGAGACLPAGLLLLLSFINRKYRYSDEAETAAAPHRTPLLGILPEVGNGNDPDEMSVAAQSVHQLRVALAAKRPDNSPSVYLITSALSGEGKTSIAMSLGLSCAASHIRTLLIDGDLVGRKLTTTLHAREMEGLHEAAATGTLRHRIRRTDSGLFVLPAGGATANDACSLSSRVVKSLINEARRYFDVIIIDSGPILGSVEASVFAREVDGVVFAISRGQSKQMVDRSMGRLNALRANVAGCVFNRARTEDFSSSPYGSSSSSRSVTDKSATPVNPEPRSERYNRFGTLVQAVAAGTPGGQN